MDPKLTKLRSLITESLRVQRGGPESIPYIDVYNTLSDVCARQNHAIFGRRGCGKTLLLHHSSKQLPSDIRAIYLNCEDFKNHSFPNVVIEILDAVFRDLKSHLSGWFGKKRKLAQVLQEIRSRLAQHRKEADEFEQKIRETTSSEVGGTVGTSVPTGTGGLKASARAALKKEREREFEERDTKIERLDKWLPALKQHLREIFDLSNDVKSVFLELDDFYHLRRSDQPYVMDYLHRLCKDVPLYFKVATLRHVSRLYAERPEQPVGAQERHDYQAINIDFTFSDFPKTESQIRQIFVEFAKRAGMTGDELIALFKGEGFRRLVLAGGGVPRDCLSLFLEALAKAQTGDDRIGKDDVRLLSRPSFERRIQELKQDSQTGEEDVLLRGVYAVRQFALDKQSNVFFISEQLLRTNDAVSDLINRLLDYRIIHSISPAMTHKSRPRDPFHSFMIDVGCYAHMRILAGRLKEYDLSSPTAREDIRSAPILSGEDLEKLFEATPDNVEEELLKEEQAA